MVSNENEINWIVTHTVTNRRTEVKMTITVDLRKVNEFWAAAVEQTGGVNYDTYDVNFQDGGKVTTRLVQDRSGIWVPREWRDRK